MTDQVSVPFTTRQQTFSRDSDNKDQTLTKPSKEVREDYLDSKYTAVSGAGSYLGAEKLYDVVREEGLYYITFKEIQEWLQEHRSYSLHRRVRKVRNRRRVIVAGIDDQFEADLAILNAPEYVDNNDGFKYLLVVIDVFTRYLWVRPLKDKFSTTVIKAFEKIFKQNGRRPRRLRTDRGTEFTAKQSTDFFANQNIAQFFTNNEVQANYVERVIQTLKKKIFRYLVANHTLRYIDVLPKLVESYNKTWHHGIRAIPKQITQKDEKRLWWQMYWPKEPFDQRLVKTKQKPVKFAFNIKDKVRISLLRNAFRREYDQRWSGEVFLIFERFQDQGIPLYKLTDYMGEEMTGSYYQNELQKITVPPDTLFIVDKIVDRQKRKGVPYVKVSYFGWPSKYDNWRKESDLVDLDNLSESDRLT